MTNNTYTCAVCKETFKKAWSDDEAEQEFSEDFKGQKLENSVLVCDDCYKRVSKNAN